MELGKRETIPGAEGLLQLVARRDEMGKTFARALAAGVGGWADTQGAHARVCAGNCELYVDPLTVIKNCPAGYHPWRNDASRTSARERGEEQRPGCAPPRIIPSRLAATSFRARSNNNLVSFYDCYTSTVTVDRTGIYFFQINYDANR